MGRVYCCHGCGRDTTRRGGYCIECCGPSGRRSSRAETVDRRNLSTNRDDPMDLEDRYDEESGPDSICDDQDPLDRGRMFPPRYHDL